MKSFICNIRWILFPFLYVRKCMLENKLYFKKMQLEQNILYNHENGVTDHKYCDHDIVVSLTTYGKRLYDVCLTIESIMEQTMKPNRIVLWIDIEYKSKKLPQSLEFLKKRGLDIRFCEDVGPHTKLIPSIKLYPNDAIITIDDDIIYNYDLIENLIKEHIEFPNIILSNRMHFIRKRTTGELMPYLKWNQGGGLYEPHPNNFPTGVGGVLYPPSCFDSEVFNTAVFRDICKYADDIWFKAMALKKGTLAKRVHCKSEIGENYIVNEEVQDIGLNLINNDKSQNDVQMKAVFERYQLNMLIK